jgi:uncharacterized small protein (DUF1192 family)
MLGSRVLMLIQSHVGALTAETLHDLTTNERTPSFRRLRPEELEARVALLFSNLARWIGDPNDHAVQEEYEEMGRTRFREGVPVSELLYGIILAKKHLRRYIREHGLVDFAGDRVLPDELMPLELHSIQELNYQIGEFFDRALYYLLRGWEAEAKIVRHPAV